MGQLYSLKYIKYVVPEILNHVKCYDPMKASDRGNQPYTPKDELHCTHSS